MDANKPVYGVSADNLSSSIDRIGYVGEKNFGIMTNDGHVYTQNERAIVYIDNKYAYHQYELDTKIEHIDEDIMDRYNTDFMKFQNNPELKQLCQSKNVDSTLGIFGEVAHGIHLMERKSVMEVHNN
ncbi:hypothetical protein [Anaerosporobacter sp.]